MEKETRHPMLLECWRGVRKSHFVTPSIYLGIRRFLIKGYCNSVAQFKQLSRRVQAALPSKTAHTEQACPEQGRPRGSCSQRGQSVRRRAGEAFGRTDTQVPYARAEAWECWTSESRAHQPEPLRREGPMARGERSKLPKRRDSPAVPRGGLPKTSTRAP